MTRELTITHKEFYRHVSIVNEILGQLYSFEEDGFADWTVSELIDVFQKRLQELRKEAS